MRAPSNVETDGPWTVRDVSSLVVRLGLGLLVALVAWAGAAGSVEVATQVRWASVSVAGVVVAGVGAAMFLVAAFHRVRDRQAAFVDRARAARPEPMTPPADGGMTVAAPAMTKYHRPSCPLVAGKSTTRSTANDQRASGREPCGVCQP